MASDNTEIIMKLRARGLDYGQIAERTGLAYTSVYMCCTRHGFKVLGEDGLCPQCGKPTGQSLGPRKRKFCSPECRQRWWNSHLDWVERGDGSTVEFICQKCGRRFTAYANTHRRYCSRGCYHMSRIKGTECTADDGGSVQQTEGI